MNFWLAALAFSVVLNLLMFVPAYIKQTDKLTDISYAVTFFALTIAGYLTSDMTGLQTVVLIMVSLWSLRLGSFLLARINRIGRDSRFDNVRNNAPKFLKFWLGQGVTVPVVMAGALLLFNSDTTKTNAITYLGILVFVGGLVIESVADSQKSTFSQKNTGKWIDVGIWRSTRHPNYLGEMLVWIGMYAAVVSSLSGLGRIVALVSPVYIILLLVFVSGIPPLEKSARKKWGKDKDFQKYLRDVPVLVPTPSSIKRALRQTKWS